MPVVPSRLSQTHDRSRAVSGQQPHLQNPCIKDDGVHLKFRWTPSPQATVSGKFVARTVTLEQGLRRAGVSVERRLYPGVTHEFFGTAAVVAKAPDAQMYAGGRLKADLKS